MLAVFKDATDSAFKAYEAAAGGLWSDYDFAHTFDASLVEEVGALHCCPCCQWSSAKLHMRLKECILQAKEVPALIIFKTYDEPTVTYDGKFEGSAIKAFIEDKTAPILVEMDQ